MLLNFMNTAVQRIVQNPYVLIILTTYGIYLMHVMHQRLPSTRILHDMNALGLFIPSYLGERW